MPFYEYQCSNCGYDLEELQTMSAPPLVKCPNCGKDTLKRLIGTGAGLIFKGSGFYLTDYKNKNASKDSGSSSKGKDTKKDSAKNSTTIDSAAKDSAKKGSDSNTSGSKSAEDKSTKKSDKKS